MFGSQLFRLLAAMLVATWSPEHRCCCQPNAADAESGGQLAFVVGFTDSAQPSDIRPIACCAETAPDTSCSPEAAPTKAGCGLGCSKSGGDDRPACACAHAWTDASLPVAMTATSPAKNTQATIDMLVQLPPTFLGVGTSRQLINCCRGSPHGPPARSLFALRCLLTI